VVKVHSTLTELPSICVVTPVGATGVYAATRTNKLVYVE
jgi:hypothetical protein